MKALRQLALLITLVMMTCVAVPHALADYTSGILPTRTYQGVTYQARPEAELTTILLIGYDHISNGEETELHGYSGGGQSDFLLLVVLDHEKQQIRQLQLDRDIMTGVRVMDSSGRRHEPMLLQLCLAHAYGSTREENNANTVWTVERLMGIGGSDDGAQIDWYMAMDISGISVLNDCLGGVTVTIPEDMTAYDPEMVQGATLTLTGSQAYYFCRHRYYVGDQTNASRMARQRLYMESAAHIFKENMKRNANYAEKLLDDMGIIYDRSLPADDPLSHLSGYVSTPTGDAGGRYLMTNETKGRIVAVLSKVLDYEILPVETLSGVHSLGSNGFIRYDLDEDAALQWSLDVFYD